MTPEQRARKVWRDLVSIEPKEAATGAVMMAMIAQAIRDALAEARRSACNE